MNTQDSRSLFSDEHSRVLLLKKKLAGGFASRAGSSLFTGGQPSKLLSGWYGAYHARGTYNNAASETTSDKSGKKASKKAKKQRKGFKAPSDVLAENKDKEVDAIFDNVKNINGQMVPRVRYYTSDGLLMWAVGIEVPFLEKALGDVLDANGISVRMINDQKDDGKGEVGDLAHTNQFTPWSSPNNNEPLAHALEHLETAGYKLDHETVKQVLRVVGEEIQEDIAEYTAIQKEDDARSLELQNEADAERAALASAMPSVSVAPDQNANI